MARMKDRKNAKRVTIPGMAGVEGRITVAEGEYLVEVLEVTQEEGSVAPYLKWKFKVNGKVHNGASLFYNTSLATQALWNLRSLLEALELEIPDEDTDMDVDDFVGRQLMVNVEHDTYEGKKQAKIVDFWPIPPDARDAEEEEEEKPAKSKAKSSKARSADDAEEEEEEAPAKSKAKSRREAVAEAGEEEEEEKPSPRNARRREKRAEKKKPMLSQGDLVDMSQEELEDVAEKYGFADIDFDDLASLRKMRNAVIEAAEEAGVLED